MDIHFIILQAQFSYAVNSNPELDAIERFFVVRVRKSTNNYCRMIAEI